MDHNSSTSTTPTESDEPSGQLVGWSHSGDAIEPVSKNTGRKLSLKQNRRSSTDGKQRRVRKACERCRVKKTKCDGESPCKRCKHDGVVCLASRRIKTESKQLPRGYAELLEDSQHTLIAIVQTLYKMVRDGQPWNLGEPELNEQGKPIVHDIAEKLGCLRQSSDAQWELPEDATEYIDPTAQVEMVEGQDREEPDKALAFAQMKDSLGPNNQQHQQYPQECPPLQPFHQSARPYSQGEDVDFNTDSVVFQDTNAFSPWSLATEEFLDPSGADETSERDMLDSYMGFGGPGDIDSFFLGQYAQHGGMNIG